MHTKETPIVQMDTNRKIYTLILFGVICAISLIILVNISINIASGIRGMVAAEGYWSKAQKDAIIQLHNYVLTEDEKYFEHFNETLKVNFNLKSDVQQRSDKNRDFLTTFGTILESNDYPKDIPDMISLVRSITWVPSIQDILSIWKEGDQKIYELSHLADSIHSKINQESLPDDQKILWAEKLQIFDSQITVISDALSSNLGDFARRINTIIQWSTIVFVLTLITIGTWLTRKFLKSTAVLAETLKKSDERFKHMLNNSRDVLYKMNLKTKKYEYVSPALKTMLGYEPEKLEKEGVEFIFNNMHPDDREEMERVVERYEHPDDKNFMPAVEFRLKDHSGNWVWVSNARSLVYGTNGKPEAIVGSVRDISTRKEQEGKIKQSLEEKEILLKEIHHRIKNNLSIISSMLELQKEGMSEEVQDLLEASQSRIKSIAKVHEKLYKSTTLSEISMDVYISELTEEITQTYASDQMDIEVTTDVDPFSMKTRQAIPFGLVLNELINNAYKHGFKDVEKGKINISFKQQGEKMELRVENTGNVAPAELNLEESDSLGMTLIHVLAERFNGDVSVETDDWTRFIITFDANQISQSSN